MKNQDKTVAIIAEFNPIHNGHKYIIEQAKRQTNANHVIIIMSGNYVQRGTPAIIDKFLRTKMALLCGADCVIELPLHYATSSSSHFAFGAIHLLSSLNCIDYLCFGSESGNLPLLQKLSDFFVQEPEEYQLLLKEFLKQGFSFPSARQKAALSYFSDTPAIKGILSNPNDALALEYLIALKKLNCTIEPICVLRKSSFYHDTTLTPFASATAIRKALLNNPSSDTKLYNSIPISCHTLFEELQNTQQLLELNDFSSLLIPLLHTNTNFSKFYDISEDLAHRISKLSKNYFSLSHFITLLKRKNFTYTSIQRALLHCILAMTQEEHDLFFTHGINYYVRILGFKKDKSSLLKIFKESSSLSIITKLNDFEKKASNNIDSSYSNVLALQMLQKERFADNLYRSVLMAKTNLYIKTDSEQGVIILS